MSDHAVIVADFATYRPIPSRKVLELRLEVPLERQAEVFAKLGWPDPSTGLPVAVAALNENAPGAEPEASSGADEEASDRRSSPEPHTATSARPRKSWHQLTRAQQAGIRCGEPSYRAWLNSHMGGRLVGPLDADEAAHLVRQQCHVTSRVALDTDVKAGARWDALETEYQRFAGLVPEERG